MKVIKKMTIAIFILLIVIIILDFIPVKFAVNINDAKMRLKDGYYICHTEPKIAPPIRWIAKRKFNLHLDDDLYVKLFGNSPNNILSIKDFDIVKWFELDNVFLLMGEVKQFKKHQESNILIADLYVSKWELFYPIKRESFRRFYAPKNYLTVYDYDWLKVIKSMGK